MARIGDWLTRAAIKPALGNLKAAPSGRGGGSALAAQSGITFVSEGQPMNVDYSAQEMAKQGYLSSVYVMRCVRTIAETIAGLPWVAGPDPTMPSNFDSDAALAKLLGPSTPQAPGGPNPQLAARIFWIWTICQYIVTGRFGWQVERDGAGKNAPIIGLWPLVSACLAPKPTYKGTNYFDGYEFTTSMGTYELTNDQVIYAWRPSIEDPRMPESPLMSATLPVYIQVNVNKYIANLLKNGLVASTLVASPPFEEPEMRRAWQDQFLAEFTGVDKAGNVVFAEVDEDDETPSSIAQKPIQVEKIATTPVDAQLLENKRDAQNDICISLGVPRSLIGDASQRTYANADSEYRNFWTLTVLDMIAEIQDHVNLFLAPRLGDGNVGWFDLARVVALQPPAIFQPPAIADVINLGVASVDQVAAALGIPAADASKDLDVETAPIGEEAVNSTASGGGKRGMSMGLGNWGDLMRFRNAEMTWRRIQGDVRPLGLNIHTLRHGWAEPVQPSYVNRHIDVRSNLVRPERPQLSTRGAGIDRASELLEKVQGTRAMMLQSRTAKTVHDKLAEHYPEDTLDWVDGADWEGPKRVNLADIEMDRRPGGRDQDKVAGIAKGLVEGSEGAVAPVVLVKTPSGKLKVADGYHRTLAHKRLKHATVPAYVGAVDDEDGPWDREMHDKKLNRQADEDDLLLRMLSPDELEAIDSLVPAIA